MYKEALKISISGFFRKHYDVISTNISLLKKNWICYPITEKIYNNKYG